MSKANTFLTLFAASVIVAAPAFSQEDLRSEVTVQGMGSFTKQTTQSGIIQDATNSGGVLANYRFFFSKSHGVEVNYGYSLNTQNYGLSLGDLGVKANQHELTAAYVYRHPMKRFTPFAEAGVGALIFDPTDLPGASSQTRAAFVYGAGADFNVVRLLQHAASLSPEVQQRLDEVLIVQH